MVTTLIVKNSWWWHYCSSELYNHTNPLNRLFTEQNMSGIMNIKIFMIPITFCSVQFKTSCGMARRDPSCPMPILQSYWYKMSPLRTTPDNTALVISGMHCLANQEGALGAPNHRLIFNKLVVVSKMGRDPCAGRHWPPVIETRCLLQIRPHQTRHLLWCVLSQLIFALS